MLRRLTGWDQIARYLNVHPNTAKRWHKYHDMPLGRSPTGKPVGNQKVLDMWLDGICAKCSENRSKKVLN